jgi:hypothetical protein
MATVPCPSCASRVEIEAKRCPQCGGSMSLFLLLVTRRPWIAAIIALGALAFVAYCDWAYTNP